MCTQNERFLKRVFPHTNLHTKHIFVKMAKKSDEMRKNGFQNVCICI